MPGHTTAVVLASVYQVHACHSNAYRDICPAERHECRVQVIQDHGRLRANFKYTHSFSSKCKVNSSALDDTSIFSSFGYGCMQ